MKRSISVVVTAILVAGLFSLPAAAVKPGTACKPVKKTTVVKNVKYTCIKQGNKFVWNKGVKVKATAPAKPPATSTNPTPAKPAEPAKPIEPAKPTTPTTPTKTSYTMEQVRANRTSAKCWTVIDDNVYDLTSWIGPHPGGDDAIESLCGVNGTSAFRSKHGRSGSPNQQLDRFLLGPLDK